METPAQTASADHRHPGNMAHHVQQLQQAGFDDSQVRSLASFVSDMARETMRPFVERVEQRFDDMQLRADQRFDDMQLRADQRHDELNQRHVELNQRLGDMQQQMDQRLGDMQQQMDQRLGDMQQQMNQRLGDMQQQMGQRLGDMQQHMDRVETRLDRLDRHTGRLGEGLAKMDARVENLQRREWVILMMMGLGFISIVVAILLAAGAIG